MPETVSETMKAVQAQDADRAALLRGIAEASAPPFDRPVPARQYNVTVQMLSRVIDELSGGQVHTAFPPANTAVDKVPPEVFLALQTLERFRVPGLEIDTLQLAASSDQFAELAGELSHWRTTDARQSRGRTASTRPDDERVAERAGIDTREQLAAESDRDAAGKLAAELTPARRPAAA